MKFIKRSAAFVLGLLLMTGSAFAQGQMQQQMQQTQPDSVTDEELEKFVSVTEDVNKKVNAEISTLLEDKEMDQKRFEEIMMSQNNPQAGGSVEMTDQEEETIKNIQPKLRKIQQKEVMNAMKENELQPQRFQAIVQALQSNPEVAQRYRQIIKEKQAQGNQN
jgi:hypothetical protein